jgi:hypothetical protein
LAADNRSPKKPLQLAIRMGWPLGLGMFPLLSRCWFLTVIESRNLLTSRGQHASTERPLPDSVDEQSCFAIARIYWVG